MKFDFNDILIEPAESTRFDSRKEISVQYEGEFSLPIFTAPMDTVVDSRSAPFFRGAGIKVVHPRTENFICCDEAMRTTQTFISLGLKDFEREYLMNRREGKNNVLIDVANGHMDKILNFTKRAKDMYGSDLVLMVGNVANPSTYRSLSLEGADYIRVGIGNGGGCLTTQQTGVGYPMASLIKECYEESLSLRNPAKIVADGGFKNYSDIIKALALGADYVMLGSIFNKALESAGTTWLGKKFHNSWTEPDKIIDQYSSESKSLLKSGAKLYKNFRGMSTKEAQLAMGRSELTTSEGISRMNEVEYTIGGWAENFRSYLKTAMSYTNCGTLEGFVGNVKFNLITENSYKRFNK